MDADRDRLNGRTERGTFAVGNQAGRGNPNALRMQKLRGQFLEALDPRVIPALSRQLQRLALKGDMEATKVLLDYALGRPAQAVELSGPDGDPLGLNVGAVTTIILGALAGPEHAETRVRIAAALRGLGDDDG